MSGKKRAQNWQARIDSYWESLGEWSSFREPGAAPIAGEHLQ